MVQRLRSEAGSRMLSCVRPRVASPPLWVMRRGQIRFSACLPSLAETWRLTPVHSIGFGFYLSSQIGLGSIVGTTRTNDSGLRSDHVRRPGCGGGPCCGVRGCSLRKSSISQGYRRSRVGTARQTAPPGYSPTPCVRRTFRCSPVERPHHAPFRRRCVTAAARRLQRFHRPFPPCWA